MDSKLRQIWIDTMKKENINFSITKVDIDSSSKIIQDTILYLTINNIWYGYGSLVFEFWVLDKKGFKGEYSIVCECDWKFQHNYMVECNSNMEKIEIKEFITKHIGKKLEKCFIIEKTSEILLDFWDIFFTTLSTYGIGLWRSLYFNLEIDWNYKSHIDSDETWIYYTTIIKKSTEILNLSW